MVNLTKRAAAMQVINTMPPNQEFMAVELAEQTNTTFTRGHCGSGLTRMEMTRFLVEFRRKGIITYRQITRNSTPIGLWQRKEGATPE